MIKLIALDIDGTLYNDEKIITPKTKEALLKAQKAGAIIVLASGRPSSGLNKESKELEMEKYHGLLLSYNGGKVVDITSNETIYENSIPNGLAKKLLGHLEQFPVTPIVDDGQYIYTNTPEGFQVPYESKANHLTIKEVNNVKDAVDFNPVKVLIASPEQDLKPVINSISEPFENELSFVLSTPFYLEATMKGTNKATSLEKICNRLNITKEEVIAFGDAQNDISMITFAGIGVAMGNACTALKDIADEITLSNNEDGIAHTLDKYFKSAD